MSHDILFSSDYYDQTIDFLRSILKESSIVLKSAVCHQSYIRHSPFRCQSRFLAIDHQIVPEGAATLLPLLIVLHALR